MNILNFIQMNWIWFVVVALATTLLMLLWIKNKAIVLMIAKQAVQEAEQALGSGMGEAKLARAITFIYERLPWVLQLIFTEKSLGKIIDAAIEWLDLMFVEGALAQSLGIVLPEDISKDGK